MKTQDFGQLPNATDISSKTLRPRFFKPDCEPRINVMHFLSEYSSPDACKVSIDNKKWMNPISTVLNRR